MKKAVRRLWDKLFRGPIGFTGAQGERGKEGHLQLSGFPDGTQICLYDNRNRLVWYGLLRKVDL